MKLNRIGPYLIIKAADFPHFQKAHKLARTMTEIQLEDVLTGRKHLHKNRGSKPKTLDVGTTAEVVGQYDGKMGRYPKVYE
jgi:hypothetical protein